VAQERERRRVPHAPVLPFDRTETHSERENGAAGLVRRARMAFSFFLPFKATETDKRAARRRMRRQAAKSLITRGQGEREKAQVALFNLIHIFHIYY